MTATLSPEWKEGGAEVIGAMWMGFTLLSIGRKRANCNVKGCFHIVTNSSCKTLPQEYNRIAGEAALCFLPQIRI